MFWLIVVLSALAAVPVAQAALGSASFTQAAAAVALVLWWRALKEIFEIKRKGEL